LIVGVRAAIFYRGMSIKTVSEFSFNRDHLMLTSIAPARRRMHVYVLAIRHYYS